MKIRIIKPTQSKCRKYKLRNWQTGDLLITITKGEAQALKDCGEDYQKRFSEFLHQLEDYSCNGSFFYFNASDYGHLSEAPCIGDERLLPLTDDEEKEPANFWLLENYMCEDFTESLRDQRYVIFQKA
jgi:hypothetical protein